MEFEAVIKLVEDAESLTRCGSDECILYKAEHENCAGCRYELGCCRLVTLKLLILRASQYTPMYKVTKQVQVVLDAKTVDKVVAAIE